MMDKYPAFPKKEIGKAIKMVLCEVFHAKK